MFLSKASVARPIAMTCVILVMLLFGLSSYSKLGLDFYPDVDVPYVTVTVVYPGASPEEIEIEIAKRLEDSVGTINGLKDMNSTSMENICILTLEFQLGVDVDIAAMDVREKIDLVKNDLPAAAEDPKIQKFDPAATPVITLMLVGELPIDEMYDYADEKLADRLSTILGVAEVQVSGGDTLEIQIEISKEKLAALGLTIPEVIQKIKAANLKVPAGRIKSGIQEVNVTYDSEFKSFDDLAALEIGNDRGRRIYLRDVAVITKQSKEKRTLAFYDGEPGVILKIVKKGDANAVKVINAIRDTVDELQAAGQIPGGMRLVWVRDSGAFIQSSVDDAVGSIVIGILLTAVILFAFLHEPRSTFIIVISMPVSIVVTFWIMAMMEYTLNTFTLLALGTSVGVLVTNSIVVIENIFKKLASGENPKDAAEHGTSEVAVPVFASAMTNVVVFVPMAMMTSLVGQFLVPFAVVMTIATLVSLFISFTLTPILASIWLRRDMPQPRWLLRWFNGTMDKLYRALERGFDWTIDIASRHVIWVLAGVVVLFFLTFRFIPVSVTFTPKDDQGEFVIKLEYPTDFNLDTTLARTRDVEKLIRALPNVEHTATVIGKVQGSVGQATEGVFLAEITVVARPKTERNEKLDDMLAMFREQLADLSNCIVTVNIPSGVGGSSAEYELKIAGENLDQLNEYGLQIAQALRDSGMARDVDTTVRSGKPEQKVIPRRPILQNMGLQSKTIGTILRGSLEGIEAGTYKIGARSYDIRVKLEDRKGLDQLKELSIGSKDGRPLNIEVVAGLKDDTMPTQINRSNRERIVKVLANTAPGVGLGDLATQVETFTGLPAGYKTIEGAMVEKMNEAMADFANTILLAVILTYLLIAAVLESWLQPFLIMFTVPLALIGIWWSLYLSGIPLSIFGLLGAVMLIGIVVNNAILIMDDVKMNQANGMRGAEAMRQAVKNKFRPIVMTSIAAILGMVPMAFGTGLGSESRASCGMPVIGGLLSSTFLSLYVIPVLYILFCRREDGTTFWTRLFHPRRHGRGKTPENAAAE